MKKTDAAVRMLMADIADLDILEIACGSGDFSVSASRYAKSVTCIDIDESRLNPKVRENGIRFAVMDGADMDYSDGVFDTAVIYNAFYHIQTQWKEIEKECRRVLKDSGNILIISSWKLDEALLKDTFGLLAVRQDGFLTVRIPAAKE